MKKRILSVLTSTALALSITAVAAGANIQNFTDIQHSDWYYASVDYAVSKGLFQGTSETAFSPNESMTRGMLVTVLGRYADVNAKEFPSTFFADVEDHAYYAPYVAWASKNNIVNGTGNGNFSPDSPITREQLSTMLYNYAKHMGADATLQSRDKYYSFVDNYYTSVYAIEAMQWATAQGIVNGYDSKLEPQGTATRAQVATMFMNAQDVLKKQDVEHPSETTPKPTPIPTVSPTIKPTPEPTPPPTEEPWTPPVVVTDEIDKRPTGKSEVDQYGGYYDYDLANYIFDAVNDIREENGLPRTAYSLKVAEWADIRSCELWQINYTDNQWGSGHVRPDGASFSTVGEGLIGENGANNSNHYNRAYLNDDKVWMIDNLYIIEQDDGTATSVTKTIPLDEFIQEWGNGIASSWYHSDGHRQNQLDKGVKTSAVSVYIIGDNAYSIHLFDSKTVHILNLNS